MDDSFRRAVKPESADSHDDHGAFSHLPPAPSEASAASQPSTTMTMSLALDYFDAKATCNLKRRKMLSGLSNASRFWLGCPQTGIPSDILSRNSPKVKRQRT